jgi:O-antigen ligase
MGNVSFFTAMLIVGVISLILSRRMAPATVGLIASLIIIDIVVIGTWVGLEKVVTRIQETTLTSAVSSREESVEQRLDVGRHSLDLIRDFPAFGTGGGSFYNSYLRYKNPEIPVFFDHTHNDYIELAADNGLIGLGLLGAFVLSSTGCVLLILMRRRSSLPRGIAFGTLMMIVSLLVHSSVDFNLQLPANALTVIVVIAMGWCARGLPRHMPYLRAPNMS